MPSCASCGTENPDVARFCLSCGTAFPAPCPSCGAAVPAGAKFCMECGTALAPGAAAPAAAPPAPAAPAGEERRPITAVFVDMVGSTSRAEQLDPEDVLALLEPYYARLRAVLERNGGVVEKFIGDAVVALFGAPVAHEDDPERAVRAGLAILDEIAGLNEEDASRDLRVRVGITTGEAIVSLDARVREGRGMAWGDVLNTAARLQSNAPVNGILVDERTARAVTAAIELEAAEPIEAKGKAEPVPVWRAVRVRPADERSGEAAPLVGRADELANLAHVWDLAVAERRPRLALVVGEPGLGKTRLIAEAAARTGAETHRGGCLSYGEGITYWPVVQIVRAAAGILSGDGARAAAAKLDRLIGGLPTDDVDQLRTIAAALSNLVGAETSPRGTYLTSEISQAELHWGIRRLLELVAHTRPLVLVLEDLHWAEPTLVELVLSILAGTAPVLLLASARPEVADAHPGLLDAADVVLALEALSDAESEELVTALLETLSDRGFDPGPVERLLRNAAGNPLFLEETVRMLLDAGPLDAAAIEALPAPESLQALVGARLDGLPPAERTLAQHASVAGLTFWSGAAARLDERTAPPDDLLESLQRRMVVGEHEPSSLSGEREWEFRHIVIRDVAYGRLPKGRRVGLHVRFAEWIRDLPQGADEVVEILAYHLERACQLAREVGRSDVAPPVAEAVDALERAGEKAELREGLREADRYYARALDLLADGDAVRALELGLRRARTLVSLGELQEATGRLGALAEAAAGAGRDDVRCGALVGLGNVAIKQGRAADARAHLLAAEALAASIGDRRLQIRAAYEAAWASGWFDGDIDGAVAKLRSTLDLAELERDLTLRVEGHLRIGLLLMNGARFAEAEAPLTRCSILASETGSVRDDARATHSLGLLNYYRGRFDECEALLRQAQEWLDRTGDSVFRIQNLRVLALNALATGRASEAEAHLREALPEATASGGWLEAEVSRLLLETLVRLGRVEDAGAIAAGWPAEDEDPNVLAARRLGEGCLAAATGDAERARGAYEDALRLLEEMHQPFELGEARLAFATALHALGDSEGARRELESARSILVEFDAPGPLAPTELALARVPAT